MKRVDTREATTSRGPEGVGPAGPATPPEPGVTWSVVLGVSEGGRREGRATSVGREERRGGREGWMDAARQGGGEEEGGRREPSRREKGPKGRGEKGGGARKTWIEVT
ncbi:hypothetical protein EYF80_036616 [Liparis tanakae]|uniref:Uncharacterized protein n=1 Tax=Liparis tanakae TaxID=230148 RepID=A0A4Z2GIT1_9TELE|nr:hypothetical protein EYF80_036616 [Liparis tanakae]